MTIDFMTDVDCVKNDWVGGFSQLEINIIYKYSKLPILHLFSGSSSIGNIRVDCNPKSKATHVMDVFDYIKDNTPEVNTILMDPIYFENIKYEGDGLYKFPYDTRKTKILWNYIIKLYPPIVIIKCLGYYTIPGYILLKGYSLYPGAFKPNRCIGIYQAKNERLML